MKLNIHLLVDRSPELPYFILAVIYIFGRADPESAHIFSVTFLFVLFSLVVGLALKTCFKTERPKRRYNLPALRYDFPSLHSMISIGMVVFFYYVNPIYAAIFIPVGLFYLYSRIKLKAHSVFGVLGGALLGMLIGFIFGISTDSIRLPETLELFFSIMLFCTPLLTTIFRMKYSERMEF
ncbi:MAG: phosphatase PAP2 family protein [Candidatus Altiarchaeota archaeon]